MIMSLRQRLPLAALAILPIVLLAGCDCSGCFNGILGTGGDSFVVRQARAKLRGHVLALPVRRATRPRTGGMGSESQQPFFSAADTVFGAVNAEQIVGLARQPDCSLSQVITQATATSNGGQVTLTSATLQTIPHYEQYLHNISGLTSTPDVFANGCDDPAAPSALGLFAYLGKTTSGENVAAAADVLRGVVALGEINSSLAYTAQPAYTLSNLGGILSADFNGDGLPDLIVLASSSASGYDSLYLYLNNGDGTLKSPTEIPMGAYVSGVVAANFRKTGHQDILASIQSSAGASSFVLLPGNGKGAFGTPVVTSSAAGVVELAADVNGDSAPDIITVTLTNPANVNVLLNNGSGSFTQSSSFALPSFGAGSVGVGDLNADGKVDLVALNPESGTMTVAMGDGEGGFTIKAVLPNIPLEGAAQVVITDMDGDGAADIVISQENGGIFGPAPEAYDGALGLVLLGHGNFTFSTPALVTPPSFSNIIDDQVAALTAAGAQDAVVLGQSAAGVTVATYLNDSGTLAYAASTAFSDLSSAGTIPAYLAVADLNNDGKQDIIVGAINNGESAGVLQAGLSNGSGGFTLKTELVVNGPPTQLVAGDFTGDGKQDIAMLLGDTSTGLTLGLYIAPGKGDGTFSGAVAVDTTLNAATILRTADINGDGLPDLIALNGQYGSPQMVYIYLNQGSGKIAPPIKLAVPSGLLVSDMLIANLSGNGKQSLGLLASAADEFLIYAGNGAGTFTLASTINLNDDGATQAIAVDVNHDGKLDLVFNGCCGLATPQIAIGAGAGKYYPPQEFQAPQSVYSVRAIALHNANYPDLLFNFGSAFAPSLNHYSAAPVTSRSATVVTINNPGTVAQGQYLEVTGTVAPASGTGTPTGTAQLSADGTVLATGTLSQGAFDFYYQLPADTPAGSLPVTVAYGGDLYNQASTGSATATVQYLTAIQFTVTPESETAGGSVTLKAKVTRPAGSGNPTGSVTFFYNSGDTVIASAPLVNGTAQLTANTASYPAGVYVLQALYDSDATDAYAVSSFVNFTLAPAGDTATNTTLAISPNAAGAGQNISVTVKVTEVGSSNLPSGTITVASGNTVFGTVPISKGAAQFSTPVPSSLYPGAYTVTAKFNGSGKVYESESQPVALTVQYPTATTLNASSTVIAAGAPITLTAYVENTYLGEGVSGTVTFLAGGTPLLTVPLSGGSAVLTESTAGVPPGTYAVTARYNASAMDAGSVSNVIDVTVQ